MERLNLTVQGQDTASLPDITQWSVRDQRELIIELANDVSLSPNERFQQLASVGEKLFSNRYLLTPTSSLIVALVAHRMAKVFAEGGCVFTEEALRGIQITADAAIDLVKSFDSQGLSNIAWAFATMEIWDNGLINALQRESIGLIKTFNAQETATMGWAAARLGIRDIGFLKTLGKHICSMKNPPARDVACILMTLGELTIASDSLYPALADKASKRAPKFSDFERAQCAFGLAISAPHFVRSVCSPSHLEECKSHFTWLNIYHALLTTGAIAPGEHASTVAEINATRKQQKLNAFELDVLDWLVTDVGIPEEWISAQEAVEGISTDFIIKGFGKPVIVECDGDRYHLTRGKHGGTPFGHDVLQDKVFRRCGYEVVHLRDNQLDSDRIDVVRRVIERALWPSR